MGLRRFISRIFLTVVLPMFCFLGVYEYLYREIPNSYKLKDTYLSQRGSDVEVLVLGSSHAFFGIDPDCFSLSTFNAAGVSQDLKYDYFIFDKHEKSLKNLKYVILPISYFSFFGSMEKGIEDWRIRKYEIYMGANDYPFYDLRYNFEFSQLGNKECLLYYFGLKEDVCDCTSLGMGTSYLLSQKSETWQKSGSVAVQRHTSYGNIDSLELKERIEQNIRYTDSLIVKCERRGISVLLVTLPSYHLYYDRLNSHQLGMMYSIIDQMVLDGKVVYVDMLKDNRFVENDFYDADHLNTFGARKASQILNQYLNDSIFKGENSYRGSLGLY